MRIPSLHLACAFLVLCGCACPSPATNETTPPTTGEPTPVEPQPDPGTGGGGDRVAVVPASHAMYGRVEGTSFQNGCQADGQCFTGGCSSEICSAEQGVNSTCEAPADGWPTTGASCGCVAGQCIWYTTGDGSGAGSGSGSGSGSGTGTGTGTGSGTLPLQGQTCGANDACAAGLSCVKYYGIAGPKGPEFKSCEIKCGAGGTCPAGQGCVTVADGPGQVCRPK